MKKDPWRGVSRVFFCARRISYKYSPPERGGSLLNCNKQLLWYVRASCACVHHWARSYLFVQQEIPCHAKKGFPDIPESLMV